MSRYQKTQSLLIKYLFSFTEEGLSFEIKKNDNPFILYHLLQSFILFFLTLFIVGIKVWIFDRYKTFDTKKLTHLWYVNTSKIGKNIFFYSSAPYFALMKNLSGL